MIKINLWKPIQILLQLALLLILGLIASGYFFLYTESGLRTIILCAETLIPTFKVQTVSGTLHSNFFLHQLSYSNKSMSFTLDSLGLSVDLPTVAKKQLIIKDLALNNLHVQRYSHSSKKSSSFSPQTLNKLFKYIQVKHFDVQTLSYAQPEKPTLNVAFGDIEQQMGGVYAYKFTSDMGDVLGNAHIQLDDAVTWQLSLALYRFNPEVMIGIPAKINTTINSVGTWSKAQHDIHIKMSEINGEVKNRMISGRADIRILNNKMNITKSEIKIGDTILTLAGLADVNSNLELTLSAPDLSKLIPNTQGKLLLKGKMSGLITTPKITAELLATNMNMNGLKSDKVVGQITTEMKDNLVLFGQLKINKLETKGYKIRSVKTMLSLSWLKDKLISQLTLDFNALSHVEANVILPHFTNFSDMKQPISGKLNFKVSDINSYLSIPELSHLNGSMKGEVILSGTLNKPNASATAQMKDAYFQVPTLGLEIKKLSLEASSELNKPLHINGKLYSGKGLLTITGDVDLFSPHYSAKLQLNGENITVVNLKEYKITASPQIVISYLNNNVIFSGKVFVPYSYIVPKNFKNVVYMPDEVIISTNAKTPVPNAYPNIGMALNVTLGNNIYLDYDNLKSSLKGHVFIQQTPGSLPSGTGELYTIKGEYQAYGKTLTIQQGRLIYTSNLLTNPGLDIRAVKQVKTVNVAGSNNSLASTTQNSVYMGSETISVGVAVKGTIKKPTVSLFSDPVLSQEDILSYLLFGYPRSQVTGASSLALLNSIASSKNGGTNIGDITQRIQNKLGLSELNVGSTNYFVTDKNKATNATTVNIGKQIGKNLTINYSRGIFSPVSIFSVRYQINKYFSLQSQASSVDNGADIFYEYERD